MPFETITLPILFFIVLNFLIIFFIKKEIDQILALIFSYVLVVFFFTITVPSYNILKEIILILSCYLIALLFIIHESDSSITNDKKSTKKFVKFFVIPTSIITMVTIFLMVIWTVVNISETSNFVETKKITKKNEELFASLKQDQKFAGTITAANNNEVYKEEKFFDTSGRKRAYIKEKLSENFLLERSSELILLIISLPLLSMLRTKKEQ